MGGAITSAAWNRHNILFLRVASDHCEFLELAFAARAMSEGALNSAAPFRFAFCLRSACRAQNTPALRTVVSK